MSNTKVYLLLDIRVFTLILVYESKIEGRDGPYQYWSKSEQIDF